MDNSAMMLVNGKIDEAIEIIKASTGSYNQDYMNVFVAMLENFKALMFFNFFNVGE